MSTTIDNGCNGCNPCNDCAGIIPSTTCAIKLDTSCVLYNVIGDGPSLLTGLNLQNGATLTEVLDAIDVKLNGITAYNVSTFNLSLLRDEYNITNLQQAIEAINNKLYSVNNKVLQLESKVFNFQTIIENFTNKIDNGDFDLLYNIIIDKTDSLKVAIEKIVNYLGALGDNNTTSNTPKLLTINTNSIAFATSGVQNHTLTANVVIAPDANNLLKLKVSGLYVEENNQTITYDPLTRKICLSKNGGCFILPLDNSSEPETRLIALNSDTIDFVTSGKNGHTITAQVNVQSVLNAITNNITLRAQFCNICSLDPCTGQVITASWTETGETRCGANFSLERKQKDNNRCSSSFNSDRWILSQANSLLCGFQSLAYCIRFDCATKQCQSTTTNTCKSVQACLVNSITNQTISSTEDLVIFYTLNIGGVLSERSFTFGSGLVAIEGDCHCAPIGTSITISNIEVVGQASNNNGIGYIQCSTTPVSPVIPITPTPTPTPTPITPTPVTPITPVVPVTPVAPVAPVSPGPVNGFTLLQDCVAKTMRVTGLFSAIGARTLSLFKDNVLVESRVINTNNVNELFTTIIGGNGYTVTIVENTNSANAFVSTNYVSPCVTQKNISASQSCVTKIITAQGSMGDAPSVVLRLFKEGVVAQTRTVTGPDYNESFTVTTDGFYYVEANKAGQPSDSITSNVINLFCFGVVPVTPPIQSNLITMTNSCATNEIRVISNVVGAQRVLVQLFRNNVIVDSQEDIGPNVDLTFTSILNGTYTAKAIHINNDANSVTSTALVVTCSTVTTVPVITPVAPVNNVSATNNCLNKTISATGRLANSNGIGVALFKGTQFISSSPTLTGNTFNWTFNNINENGTYNIRVYEVNNDINFLTSSGVAFTCNNPVVVVPVVPGPTTPANRVIINGDCAGKSIAADITLTKQQPANQIGVYLLRDNVIIRQINVPTQTQFIVGFNDLLENGTYRVFVFEANNDTNNLTSGNVVFSCNTATPPPVITPAPVTSTPPPPSIFVSGDCAGQSMAVDVKINSPNGTVVKLFRNDVLVRTSNTIFDSSFIIGFNNLSENGTYRAYAQDTVNANGLTSSNIVFSCNTVTPPTVCTRPTGLTRYKLGFNYTLTSTGASSLFSSLADACTRTGQFFASNTVSGITNFFVDAANLNIGSKVFLGVTNDCNPVSSNFYTVLDSNGNNTIKKAIQTDNNGNILAVVDCQPVTAPPAVVVTPNDGILNTGALAVNIFGYEGAGYEVYLKMNTPELPESNQSIKVSSNDLERLMGGTTVENSLAVMSKRGSNPSSGGTFYYSAGMSILNLKNKYPNQSTVEFELGVKGFDTNSKIWRINISAVETAGLVTKTDTTQSPDITGKGYDYSSSATADSSGGFWIIPPINQSTFDSINGAIIPWVRFTIDLNTKVTTFRLIRGTPNTNGSSISSPFIT